MPTRARKIPRDANAGAAEIVKVALGEAEPEEESDKNPHALALGRLDEKKGRKVRAAKLTKQERSESARIAALAR